MILWKVGIFQVIRKSCFIQLYDYLNVNNLSYKSQYEVRNLHPTELAPLEMIDIVMKDIDSKKLPIGVFSDLLKAFNTLYGIIL